MIGGRMVVFHCFTAFFVCSRRAGSRDHYFFIAHLTDFHRLGSRDDSPRLAPHEGRRMCHCDTPSMANRIRTMKKFSRRIRRMKGLLARATTIFFYYTQTLRTFTDLARLKFAYYRLARPLIFLTTD